MSKKKYRRISCYICKEWSRSPAIRYVFVPHGYAPNVDFRVGVCWKCPNPDVSYTAEEVYLYE